MVERAELTGTLSRDALYVAIGRLEGSPAGQQQSLLLVDIDCFKQYNDVFGNDAGDLVLQKLAGLLQHTVPSSCEIGRLGGDEFLVFLPRTAIAAAQVVAETIRELFACSADAGGLTLTVGVATTPADRQWECQQLVELADLRTVVAKKRLQPGRNCTWAGDLPDGWQGARFFQWPTSGTYPSSAR